MDGFKQRIIGAVVLISLAVIFVPMLFDEPHTERRSQSIDLPEEPAFPEVKVDQPEKPQQKPQNTSPNYRLEEKSAAGADTDGSANGSVSTSNSAEPDSAPVSSETPVQSPAGNQPSADSAPQAGPADPDAGETRAQSSGKRGSGKHKNGDKSPTDKSSNETSEKTASVETQEFSESLKGAWLVQLGSFGKQSTARRLRDKVREAGYAAHTQAIKRGDSTLTRVFSGPFAVKSDAENAKKKLDKTFSVNSLVMAGDK